MSANESTVSRRGLLRTTAGGAACLAVGSATGAAAAQEGEKPDFGGYLDDVGNYDGTVADARGQNAVSVTIGAQGNGGAFAFGPPAVHVDSGATVTWEWTGEGGSHNVVHEEGDFESELVGDEGHTFEYTFEEDGIYLYYCQPHKGLGMKGAVVVGSDYATTSGGGGGGGDGDGSGGGSDGSDGGDGGAAPESAGNQTAAYTLIGMLTLGFLSPLVFALLVRRRMGRGS
ncbi:halocyanin domain-containing protein [Halobacteriales archaeon Cl-PHB]